MAIKGNFYLSSLTSRTMFSVLIVITIVVNCVFMARTDSGPEYVE